MKKGVLYGIGVGPGAPDLITLRAARLLGSVDVILAAASPSNEYSLALEIARPHLAREARVVRLHFPMTRDKKALQEAWHEAASTSIAILAGGENAAFLTLGDPLIYSTFSYLQKAIKKLDPDAAIHVVPAVTSFQAAAARTGLSLCEGGEPFTVIPGIASEAELRKLLDNPGAAAILKVYRNHETIRKALAGSGRAEKSLQISFVEQDREEIRQGPGAEKPPYMTLLLCPPRGGWEREE